MGIERVTQDAIDRQVTAKALIGKNVYDNQGQRVGEVKDVVLDTSSVPQLASAFSGRHSDADRNSSSTSSSGMGSGAGSSARTSSAGSMGSTDGSTSGSMGSSTTGSTGTMSGTSRSGTSGSGYASTSGSSEASRSTSGNGLRGSIGSGISSAMSALSGSGPAAIISSGGFLGVGNDLVRVPLSQLSYDSGNDRLTLSVSRSELTSITEGSSSRSAAE